MKTYVITLFFLLIYQLPLQAQNDTISFIPNLSIGDKFSLSYLIESSFEADTAEKNKLSYNVITTGNIHFEVLKTGKELNRDSMYLSARFDKVNTSIQYNGITYNMQTDTNTAPYEFPTPDNTQNVDTNNLSQIAKELKKMFLLLPNVPMNYYLDYSHLPYLHLDIVEFPSPEKHIERKHFEFKKALQQHFGLLVFMYSFMVPTEYFSNMFMKTKMQPSTNTWTTQARVYDLSTVSLFNVNYELSDTTYDEIAYTGVGVPDTAYREVDKKHFEQFEESGEYYQKALFHSKSRMLKTGSIIYNSKIHTVDMGVPATVILKSEQHYETYNLQLKNK